MNQKLNNDIAFKQEFEMDERNVIDDEDIKENDVKDSLSVENISEIITTIIAGTVIYNPKILAEELVILSLGNKNLKYPD